MTPARKILAFLLLTVNATAAHALPAIHGERLFRVVASGGQVSFVMAAAHGVVTSRQKLAPVSIVLRQSCQVYLQGDLFRETDIKDADLTGDLREILGADQLRTYQRIVGAGEDLLRIGPGLANTLVRSELGDALVRATEAFDLKLRRADVRTQGRLLDANSFDPSLREGLELLFGETFSPSILVSTVMRILAEDERDRVIIRSHADHVRAEAEVLEHPVTELVPPPGQSGLQAQLRLLDAAALRKALDQLTGRLGDGGALFVDARAAFLIAREANARYFDLSPEQYGHAQDMLAKSLLDHRVVFDGDDALTGHHANLHDAWFEQLMAAVEQGGAFIVMDAERVIPGVNSKVNRTFLDEIENRGARVTPFSAERTRLSRVK